MSQNGTGRNKLVRMDNLDRGPYLLFCHYQFSQLTNKFAERENCFGHARGAVCQKSPPFFDINRRPATLPPGPARRVLAGRGTGWPPIPCHRRGHGKTWHTAHYAMTSVLRTRQVPIRSQEKRQLQKSQDASCPDTKIEHCA